MEIRLIFISGSRGQLYSCSMSVNTSTRTCTQKRAHARAHTHAHTHCRRQKYKYKSPDHIYIWELAKQTQATRLKIRIMISQWRRCGFCVHQSSWKRHDFCISHRGKGVVSVSVSHSGVGVASGFISHRGKGHGFSVRHSSFCGFQFHWRCLSYVSISHNGGWAMCPSITVVASICLSATVDEVWSLSRSITVMEARTLSVSHSDGGVASLSQSTQTTSKSDYSLLVSDCDYFFIHLIYPWSFIEMPIKTFSHNFIMDFTALILAGFK